MKVIPTAIPDVLIIEPKVFGDERGFFFESFNQKLWEEKTGLKTTFVQWTSGDVLVYLSNLKTNYPKGT